MLSHFIRHINSDAFLNKKQLITAIRTKDLSDINPRECEANEIDKFSEKFTLNNGNSNARSSQKRNSNEIPNRLEC